MRAFCLWLISWLITLRRVLAVMLGVAVLSLLVMRYLVEASPWATLFVMVVAMLVCGLVQFIREGDRQIKLEEGEKAAFQAWQSKHADPVFGLPGGGDGQDFYILGGSFNHPVEYMPSEGLRCEVSVGSQGITERQREYYQHVVRDFGAIFERIYPAVNAAYRGGEAREAGEMIARPGIDFPKTAWLDSLKIGEDVGGVLESTEIHLSYEQDAWVAVRMKGEEVVGMEFYM